MFAEVGELDFPALEREVLEFWEREDVFALLRRKNSGGRPFSFIDGPITANHPRGIGVHHAWGRTYKDVFQRHRAMLGYEQRFQNGFDGQGLWVEVEVEKELGLNGKGEILEYGLERFARQCRARVERSAAAIERSSRRLGQWMDWGHSYYTHADANIEYIWHFLKVCQARGWLYRGHRVMPWCTRCGTSLSQHELADAHRETEHRALYVKLPLIGRQGAAQQAVRRALVPWKEVSAGEGTGIVHIAPGCGAGDHALGRECGLSRRTFPTGTCGSIAGASGRAAATRTKKQLTGPCARLWSP